MASLAARWWDRHVVGLLAAAVLVVAVIIAGWVVLGHVVGRPTEHGNPSFRYGEKLMHNYGAFDYAPAGASTKDAC